MVKRQSVRMCAGGLFTVQDVFSAERTQVHPKAFGIVAGKLLLHGTVRRLPDRYRLRKQLASFGREDQNATAAVGCIFRDLHKSATFQRFQRGGQRGAIHCQEGSHGAHGRRNGTIKRHQERELPIGEIKRAKSLIKASSQGARRTLDVQAQTAIPHQESRFVR